MIYRKTPFSNLSVEIDLKELQTFLTKTIPKYCTENQGLLIKRSKMYGEGLAKRYKSQDHTADEDELNEIISILMVFLEKSPRSLPLDVAKQVHSFIGFIKGMQQFYDEAIQSFLKVLWIETAKLKGSKLNNNPKKKLRKSIGRKQESLDDNNSNERNPEDINALLTTHRLALMYGKNKNYVEATILLERVLSGYKQLNMKENHRIYRHAKQSLSAFRGDFSNSSGDFFSERSTLLTMPVNIGQHATMESMRSLQFSTDRFLGKGRRRSM